MLNQLIELVREKNIFRWDRKRIEIKLIATILYYAGISLRKTSKFLKDFDNFSHEALRQWYHKFARLFTNSTKYRICIAIDETKIKIGYVWAAIDVDTNQCYLLMLSQLRNQCIFASLNPILLLLYNCYQLKKIMRSLQLHIPPYKRMEFDYIASKKQHKQSI